MTTPHIPPPWGTNWKPDDQPALPGDPVRTKGGRWVAGQSGNPAGRKPGTPNKRSPLEVQVAQHGEAIMAKVIEAALGGDLQAANIALQRISAPLKARSGSVNFEFTPGAPLAEQAQEVVAAVASGSIDPDTGKVLIDCLTAAANLRTVDEFEARLAALETRGSGEGRRAGVVISSEGLPE